MAADVWNRWNWTAASTVHGRAVQGHWGSQTNCAQQDATHLLTRGGQVAEGICNAELFYLAQTFFPYIETLGKRIYPLPPRVAAETMALLDANVPASIKSWLESCTTPVDAEDATFQEEIKAEICKAVPLAHERHFAAAGLYHERSKHRRYFSYKYPEVHGLKAVKLKTDDA